MRRRLGRRSQLVRVKTKAKNEIHAALMRRLIERPKVSDLFGIKGRRWLESVELPAEERETVEGCLRQLDFCEAEIAAAERVIAAEALRSPEIRRLMTVPGVNVITAATFMAAIGEIGRFPSRRKLVGYLGLDPKVRQSGASAASRGRISKQGSVLGSPRPGRGIVERGRAPGPMHSFYERIRARRGHQVAIVAASRKLACLFWCMLTREEDYAYGQPSLTRKKLRRLELGAGAPKGEVERGLWSTNEAMRSAEHELARQAEAAYERTVADWQRGEREKGAGATPGRASQAARQGSAPEPAL